MADTAYTNGVTLTDADWFNDVNRLHYTLLADPANLASAHQAFFSGGVAQNIAVGGTLSVSAGSFVQSLQVGGVLSVSGQAAVQALQVAGVLSVSAQATMAGLTVGGVLSTSATAAMQGLRVGGVLSVSGLAAVQALQVSGTFSVSAQATVTVSTFTFNGSGGTTGSLTMTYQKIGNFVTLNIPAATATTGTGSTTLTSDTALAAGVRPAADQWSPSNVINNNNAAASDAGVVKVDTSGILTIQRTYAASAWTNAATGGLGAPVTIIYFIG